MCHLHLKLCTPPGRAVFFTLAVLLGVLALAVAVIVLYLRLPELLDTRLQPAEQRHANSKQNIADPNTETHPMSEQKSEGSQE